MLAFYTFHSAVCMRFSSWNVKSFYFHRETVKVNFLSSWFVIQDPPPPCTPPTWCRQSQCTCHLIGRPIADIVIDNLEVVREPRTLNLTSWNRVSPWTQPRTPPPPPPRQYQPIQRGFETGNGIALRAGSPGGGHSHICPVQGMCRSKDPPFWPDGTRA